jgi:glutathione S-transferase
VDFRAISKLYPDLFLGVSASKYAARMGFVCLDDATIAKVRKSLNDEVLPRHLGFFEELLKRSTTVWLSWSLIRCGLYKLRLSNKHLRGDR